MCVCHLAAYLSQLRASAASQSLLLQKDYETVWPRLAEDQQEKRVNVRVKFGQELWDRQVGWQDQDCLLLMGLVAST